QERNQIEKHQEQFDLLKHQLQAKIQQAERAIFTNGSVTWKKSKDSISLDSKALLKQYPEYLNHFPQTKQGSRRFNIYSD
ncbi:MAG: YqaJ-like viral recombinase, partial [Acinetobacter sp.]